MFKFLKDRRGEGYIDVVVTVLCSMMLIVLAVNTFSFLSLKQNLDYVAKEILASAVIEGETKTAPAARLEELKRQTGIIPDRVEWTAAYWDTAAKKVQLGDEIKVKITMRTEFQGIGIIKIPITVTASNSALCQRYWKTR